MKYTITFVLFLSLQLGFVYCLCRLSYNKGLEEGCTRAAFFLGSKDEYKQCWSKNLLELFLRK